MFKLNFDKIGGYIIAVVQDAQTSEVLNAGLMSKESLRLAITSGSVVFSSTGRERYWTNGHILWGYSNTVRVLVDCDRDTLLFKVNPRSTACNKHFGSLSCFHLTTSQLDFDKLGDLVISIIQDVKTKKVLMVGTMNSEALGRTLESGYVAFWSRTKKRLWFKGKTSGNTLKLESVLVNCHRNSLLCQVTLLGPTCHAGASSCFENPDGTEREFP